MGANDIKILIAITVILLLIGVNFAMASEVTGTLSTGLTGNVNDPLIGTVITPPISSGGGYSGGGGGGGYSSPIVKPVITPIATTTPLKPLVLGVSTFRFTRTLKFGSSGNDVKELQKRLKTEGVFRGPITGYFGNLTKTALISYQKKNKLPQNGTLYLKVRKKLNS